MKNTWRHDIGRPHQYAKRKGHYYEFRSYKIVRAYMEGYLKGLKRVSSGSKMETYLNSNGFKMTGASYFTSCETNSGGLYRYYHKNNYTIFYGMFIYKQGVHLWIAYELMRMINIEHLIERYKDLVKPKEGSYFVITDLDHLMMKRIESVIDPSIIENVLMNRKHCFLWNGITDKISVEPREFIDKVSLPGGIEFVLEAKRRGIEII